MPTYHSLALDCSDLTHSQPSRHPHTITIITLLFTLNVHKSLTHSLTDKSTPAWLPSSHYFLLWMPINCSLTPDCSDLTHSQPSRHPHTITIITLLITLNAHKLLTHSLTHSLTCSWTSQYPHNYHHHTLFHSECSPITHSLWRSLNLLTTCQIASVHLLLSCYISLCNLVSHLRFALSTSIRNFLTTTPTRAYDLHACFLHATANFAKRSSKCKVASVFIGRNVSGTRCIRH